MIILSHSIIFFLFIILYSISICFPLWITLNSHNMPMMAGKPLTPSPHPSDRYRGVGVRRGRSDHSVRPGYGLQPGDRRGVCCMDSCGFLWDIIIMVYYHGTSWYIIMVYDGIYQYGLWWYMMVYDGIWWCNMVYLIAKPLVSQSRDSNANPSLAVSWRVELTVSWGMVHGLLLQTRKKPGELFVTLVFVQRHAKTIHPSQSLQLDSVNYKNNIF